MTRRPNIEWRRAEQVVQLRLFAAIAWLGVCALGCALGDFPGRFESLDPAGAYLAIAGALYVASRWSGTTHAGSFAALMLLDAPVLAAIQTFGVPFAPGSPALMAVSVWFFAFVLLAGALTCSVRAVGALALEGTLLQGALMAHGHLPDELIGATLAVFATLAGLSVPITLQLCRAAALSRRD